MKSLYYQAIRTKKCRVSNFEVNFLKIRFLVIEQNDSQATIWELISLPYTKICTRYLHLISF